MIWHSHLLPLRFPGMVDEISAVGLRHVGYAVPVEFFGPFVTACVESLASRASAEVLETQQHLALEPFKIPGDGRKPMEITISWIYADTFW